jgi:hypothetical protein
MTEEKALMIACLVQEMIFINSIIYFALLIIRSWILFFAKDWLIQ